MLAASLGRVAGNRSLMRVELGWLAGITADGAYLVSLLVFAYEAGGVVGAGLVTTARALPAGILAPFLSAVADRVPRQRLLLAVHLARAAILGSVALIAALDMPFAFVFLPVALEGLLVGLNRATTLSLMPALARSPEELVAANALISLGEGIGALIGPLGAGVLLAFFGPGVGLSAAASAYLLAAACVVSIQIVTVRRASPAGATSTGSSVAALLGGVRALRRYPSAGLVVGLFSSQSMIRGALYVLIVTVAVELLDVGRSGVGVLTSAIGAGGLVGASLAMTFVTGGRLSRPFALSLALWGAPIAFLGVSGNPAVAFGLLAVVGAANASLDISGFTLLQRCVPNEVRGRVFGALEGGAALGLALGGAIAPVLVQLLGVQVALAVTGALLPALAVLSYRSLRHADDAAIVPHRELSILRQIPMFAPLPLTVIEHLAQSLEPRRYEAGAEIIHQGDAGDCFFVVASGSVEVVHDGSRVAVLGAGDGFGEIALLSERPRTASVIANEPMEAFRLPRIAFLEAITGSTPSVDAADQLMTRRLAELGH